MESAHMAGRTGDDVRRQEVRILRFNPERDAEPHYESYEVDIIASTTVLDAVIAVKDFEDGTLTFRRSCRQGICGSCGMRVNDKERLACNTRVAEIIKEGQTMTVEPMANYPVIKDLVVDMSGFWRKYKEIQPFVIHDPAKPVPEKEYRVAHETVRHLQQFAGCIQCGLCYSSCPIVGTDPDYIGPAALAKAYRFVGDPRDDATRERLRIVGDEDGVWRCHTIFNCTEVCPKGVEPTYAIQQMTRMSIRRRIFGG
jgi:succinate dehydrogenase / fumarate reductase iron-sulfur subunit